jgi:hypothetical protein
MKCLVDTNRGGGFEVVGFLIVALLANDAALAQDIKKEASSADAPYVFERIENVELSKKEIVAHTSAFIAEKFVSARSVIQLNDSELGKLVGDVVLMNTQAGFFDAFKGIKTRLVLDARDGRYRLQASNVEGIDGNGVVPAMWGKLESANRYRIEPLAQSLLKALAEDLSEYLKKAKEKANF